MRRSCTSSLRPIAVLLVCALAPGLSVAQVGIAARPGEPFGGVAGGSVGYELALVGATTTERGATLVFSGVTYEVTGAVTLRETPGLEVEVTLEAWNAAGTAWRTIGTRTVRSEADGRFVVSVPMPDETLASPRASFRVRRVGAPGRLFVFDVGALASRQLDLLTDRDRYEPGETAHVWTRLTSARSGAPEGDRPLTITLSSPTGAELFREELRSRASGSVAVDVPLADTLAIGSYTVRVESDATTLPASRVIEVFARTTERLAASIELDDDLVVPGAPITGVVRVTDPSGAPIRGATVELYASYATYEPLRLESGRDGTVRFSAVAPTYIDGDVGYDTMTARVTHGAAGTITTTRGYTIARTAWLVSATAEAGALVPELDTQLFLAITDPRSTPIPAGVEVEVRGLGVPHGRATVTTDAHGLAEVTLHVPRAAAARMDGGGCAGSVSTSLEVEIHTTPPVTATLCALVALEAEVLPRVRSPVVAPGASLEVDLFRRTSGTPVLVELLLAERVVAAAWATGARATLMVPADVRGVLDVRARVITAGDAHAPLDEDGLTLTGTGARAAVLARPADAFALSVTPSHPVAHVREHASVELRSTTAPSAGAWATLVVRDEAQHGGESDYAMESVAATLRAAVRGTLAPSDERLVRAALAGDLAAEPEADGAPPITPEPWEVAAGYGYGYGSLGGGVLRDPIALRETSVRTGATAAMMALERLVASLSTLDSVARARVTSHVGSRVDFGADAMSLAGLETALTLGGLPLTPAHLHEIDASFSFDAAARRAARSRLVFLLVALARLGSPSDEAALRATATESADRWLSVLVRLRMVRADQLVDPWGRPYTLRRITGRSPVVVFSERAIDWELSSPGPDGTAGNADDVRDPFARVVPEGTPYAVASGEDELLRRLSRIAPGTNVLLAMATAYADLGLGAEEERRGGALVATTSEGTEMPATETTNGIDDLLAGALGSGTTRGGFAMADGPTTTADPYAADFEGESGRYRERPDEPAPTTPAETPAAVAPTPPPPPGMPTLAAVIREDFPATLFFVGEVALDGTGRADVDVPLADAITTYRLEAIAWSGTGWTSSGRGSLRVEQEAEVDAPIPEMSVVGDVMRLPLRVRNRGTSPLSVRVAVRVEGDAGVEAAEPASLEVPAGDAAMTIVALRATRAGAGALVVELVRDDGSALDAVRRPIEIVDDRRLVRARTERIVSSGEALTLEIPADAVSRGDGEIRLRVAAAVFGDPASWWSDDPPAAGFALALAGRPLPEDLVSALTPWAVDDGGYGGRPHRYQDAVTLASVLGALWSSERMTEAAALSVIRELSARAGGMDAASGYEVGRSELSDHASVLLALAPALRSEARPTIRAGLEALRALLADHASSDGATTSEDPVTFARVAAALALTAGSDADRARADEMLRRLERHVVTARNLAWLEPIFDDGSIEPRVEPTALVALARIARGDRISARTLIATLATLARGSARWLSRRRALACAAAGMLASERVTRDDVRLTVDGAPVVLDESSDAPRATSATLGVPGSHTILPHLPEGAIAVLETEVRYALPWAELGAVGARVEVEWTGDVGPRDARSGLSLSIHNRSARVLVRPVVEIQLPAGAELDETTREGLATATGAAPGIEGNVLRLELRPIAPGGRVRIPLRVRWALGGSLRGLGVSVTDEAVVATRAEGGLVAVLPPRSVEIADEGPEPRADDVDLSGPPRAVPPPISPLPRPLREALP